MKKAVLMSLETAMLEWSPAKYQLLDALSDRGFETYVFLKGRLKNRKSYKSVSHVINTQNMSDKEIQKEIIKISPQAVIATLYTDTVVIYKLPYIMRNTSFYYYNLEIYTPYLNKDIRNENFQFYMEYKMQYPINKVKERLYTQKVKAFTIQDNLRKKLSAKYHIYHSNTILIPNSYVFNESDIVPENQNGIIYTGGIKRDFLLEQFNDLKKVKDVSLTLSGYIDQWCKREIKNLRRTNPNIKFEEQSLSIDDYTKYLQQFAVGLVWYSPLKEDEAHYYMGLSSGKMFKHFSLGQPIIATKCPGITEIVNKYKLGVIIENISELAGAYNKVMENYSYYRTNVINTYKNKFDFKKAVIPFLDYIENITYSKIINADCGGSL